MWRTTTFGGQGRRALVQSHTLAQGASSSLLGTRGLVSAARRSLGRARRTNDQVARQNRRALAPTHRKLARMVMKRVSRVRRFRGGVAQNVARGLACMLLDQRLRRAVSALARAALMSRKDGDLRIAELECTCHSGGGSQAPWSQVLRRQEDVGSVPRWIVGHSLNGSAGPLPALPADGVCGHV